MRDMETIMVFVLLAFNFMPQRLHHLLTCRGHGSGTENGSLETLTPVDGTTNDKVKSYRHNRTACSPE